VNAATRSLAAIGSAGNAVPNAERDLRRLLLRHCGLPLVQLSIAPTRTVAKHKHNV
jgi:hypothetical protein